MAAFCHYWRISPADYWALTVDEVSVMTDFANELAATEVPDG